MNQRNRLRDLAKATVLQIQGIEYDSREICEVTREWMFCLVNLLMDVADELDLLRLVTSKEWDKAREKESEASIHPCNSYDPTACDCRGACDCHWVRE